MFLSLAVNKTNEDNTKKMLVQEQQQDTVTIHYCYKTFLTCFRDTNMHSCASVSVVFESAMNDSLFLSYWSKTITFFIRITTQTRSKLLTKKKTTTKCNDVEMHTTGKLY
jgi:hypothetical protein